MKLRAMSRAPAPGYPMRRRLRRSGRGWLGRMTAVAAASASLLGILSLPVACAGSIQPPSYFVCSDGPPVEEALPMALGSYQGWLCGESDAWGSLVVDGAYSAQVELESLDDAAEAHVVSPEGAEVAALDAEQPAAEVALTPGSWSIVVSPVDRGEGAWSGFNIHVTALEPER